MNYLSVFCFLLFALLLGCDPADRDEIILPVEPADCGRSVEVLPEPQWGDGPALMGARVESIDGLCMVVNYTWVGCSDQGLPLRLLTEGAVAESFPTQTEVALRFSVATGASPCAIFENQRDTFDLAPYLTGSLPTRLRVVGADTTVLVGEL